MNWVIEGEAGAFAIALCALLVARRVEDRAVALWLTVLSVLSGARGAHLLARARRDGA